MLGLHVSNIRFSVLPTSVCSHGLVVFAASVAALVCLVSIAVPTVVSSGVAHFRLYLFLPPKVGPKLPPDLASELPSIL